jgi:hypothetical protein
MKTAKNTLLVAVATIGSVVLVAVNALELPYMMVAANL